MSHEAPHEAGLQQEWPQNCSCAGDHGVPSKGQLLGALCSHLPKAQACPKGPNSQNPNSGGSSKGISAEAERREAPGCTSPGLVESPSPCPAARAPPAPSHGAGVVPWPRPPPGSELPSSPLVFHSLFFFFCCQRRALKSAGTAKNPVCTTTPQTSLYFYCSVNYCLNFNKSLRQEGGPAVRFLCKHWARR